MTHFLHFGPGANQLPEPWQNLDQSHDIRKALRFDNDSAMGVMAEHVIEHVPYLQGLRFFAEAWRVLALGGVLRVTFPDVSRFIASDFVGSPRGAMGLNHGAELYGAGLEKHLCVDTPPRLAVSLLLTGWGHQMAWTRDSCAAALLATGFSSVQYFEYGTGLFGECDGHHRDVGIDVAKLETTALEATK